MSLILGRLIGGNNGGSVQSVTGDAVDNTDPLNPVVNQSPTQTSILVTNGSVTTTTVTNDPTAFVNAKVDNISGVSAGYSSPFTQETVGEAALLFNGIEEDYIFRIGGKVTSTDPSSSGAFVVVKVEGDIQGDFTGGSKPYPLGVSVGGLRQAGFEVTVFGKFPAGEVIRVKLSSQSASDLIVSDCIYTAQKIQPFS